MHRRITYSAAVLLIGLALAACSPDRFGATLMKNFTATEIYQAGESDLSRGRAADAAELFGEVERLYPYSEWAKRAIIMQAFAHHRARDYAASRAAGQRYVAFYPADQDAAYAAYLVALSYYDQIDEVGHDQGVTINALQSLRQVIEVYPASEYARSSELKFDLAFDHLAAKEMEVGRFYQRRGNFAAAINRFRLVVENFDTSTHTPEALHRLVEAYVALGLTGEAQTAAALLGHNYQGSVWYQDSHALLTGQGLRPQGSDGGGWLAALWRRSQV